jgi:PilZ domain
MHETKQSERRRSRRVRMKQGLRVRPTNPQDGTFEEISTTANMSQGGIYFITKRDDYREGMRLFVTAPYHSPHSPQNYEYLGQIARIDVLESGQKGVAVTFLPSFRKKSRCE